MKKLICIDFMLFLSIFTLFSQNIYAFEEDLEESLEFSEISEIEEALQTVSSVSDYPDVSAKHILVLDRDCKRVLFEKDGFTKTPMASTTKILTSIIAIERCNLNEKVSISRTASSINGSTVGIIANSEMTMRDLLYGLMLRSGNDCAIAIAEYIGGDINHFSTIMNQKAKEIGLKNSNFTSPHGLDDDNHYTTAYELAILTDYALQNKTFKTIVSTKETTIKVGNSVNTISNTNELLGNFDGVYGVKTGFTFNSGRCLVTACKRGNLDLIAVVLGADTKKIRTIDSMKVLNYAFKNFSKIDISNIIYEEFYNFENYYSNTVITKKTTDFPRIQLESIDNTIFPLRTDELNSITSEIYSLNILNAPKLEGTKIGEITVKVNDEILLSSNIITSNNLNRKKWQTY